MPVEAVLQGDHGARISVAVVKVAQKVESAVNRIVTAATTTPSTPYSSSVPGACAIKQVRRASGKLVAAKPVSAAQAAPSPLQPHISVTVAPLGGVSQPSKWEEDSAAKTTVAASKGRMMIDTGAAITLVTKAWADAHGLQIRPSSGIAVRGASRQSITVVGTTSMTV